jgi:hypothetical protein
MWNVRCPRLLFSCFMRGRWQVSYLSADGRTIAAVVCGSAEVEVEAVERKDVEYFSRVEPQLKGRYYRELAAVIVRGGRASCSLAPLFFFLLAHMENPCRA